MTTVYHVCERGHMTKLRYPACPICAQPFVRKIYTPQTRAGWRLSVTDWTFLRVQKIDPEQPEPVYR